MRSGLHAIVLPFVFAVGCGGSTTPVCGAGRINVDGVCANELVADYVACVRAQGAQLGEDKSRKLAADAAYAGAKASVVADAKDTLEKKYSASDAAVLEIVRTCSTFARAGAARPGNGSEGMTRSENTGVPVEIRFVNRRAEPVTVSWVDLAGVEKPYGTIAAGAELPMKTFVRHLWVFRRAGGAEVWRWHAASSDVAGAVQIP